MTFKQAEHTLVFFAASAKTLWSVTRVNQRLEDEEGGYQRAVSPARAQKIAQFIDSSQIIPTSVLISFEHAHLSKDRTILRVENRKDAGWIIDGQHRLAGGNQAELDITLPVIALTDLDLTEQINCFVTINREQKGVPASLYLELLKNIPGTRDAAREAKERTVDIAHQLRKDEASPFHGKIVSTTSPRKGQLSLTNFVRKVHPMLKTGGRLSEFSDEERCKILNNYYLGLMQAFPSEFEREESVFFRTIGFGALMGTLPTFLDMTLTHSGGFRVKDTSEMFRRIGHFDFSHWRGRSGSGCLGSEFKWNLRAEFCLSPLSAMNHI